MSAVVESTKNINLRYIIAIIFMLLFVFSDLLFDFAFSFDKSDLVAFIFTVLSAIIVFLGTWKVKKDERTKSYYEATKFIKSNFDNAQVVFSILDIICGLISLFSTYFFLSYTFKIVKFFYIPTKIVVVINKEKSLLKPIIKFSYLWSAMRILEKKGGNMFNFIKRNKWTLIIGTVISLATTFALYKILPLYVSIPLYGLILSCVGMFALTFAGCYFLGNDTVKSALFRLAEKILPKEESDKICEAVGNAVKEVEEAKAKAQEEKNIEAEAIRRINAEKAEAEAKAKQEAKAEAEAAAKAKAQAEAEVEKVQVNNAKAAFEARVRAKMAEMKNNIK